MSYIFLESSVNILIKLIYHCIVLIKVSVVTLTLSLQHNTSCVSVFQPHSNISVNNIFLKCYTMK